MAAVFFIRPVYAGPVLLQSDVKSAKVHIFERGIKRRVMLGPLFPIFNRRRGAGDGRLKGLSSVLADLLEIHLSPSSLIRCEFDRMKTRPMSSVITHFFSRQWCLAVAIGLVLPGLKSPAWTYAVEAEETVEKLVQKLGAGDYDAREKAQKELMSRGVDALETLLASLNSDDPEAAWRIVELLERISLQTRDPDKVQRVVERLMNVTGQLRREFAIRGTSLQPKIDSFKSDLAIRHLQQLGARVKVSSNKTEASFSGWDPVAMDPIAVELEMETKETLSNEELANANQASGKASDGEVVPIEGNLAQSFSVEPLWDLNHPPQRLPVRDGDTQAAAEVKSTENGIQVIQIQQLGGFRVAVNPKVAGLIVDPTAIEEERSKLKRRRQPISEKSVQIGASWKGSEEDFATLRKIEGLVGLQISGLELDASKLAVIRSLPRLQSINLDRCEVEYGTLLRLQAARPQLRMNVQATAKMGVFGGNGPNGELGCWIESLVSGGPAANSGLQPGEQVLSVDGFQIRDFEQLSLYVSLQAPGDVLRFEVRNSEGRVREVRVELVRREER